MAFYAIICLIQQFEADFQKPEFRNHPEHFHPCKYIFNNAVEQDVYGLDHYLLPWVKVQIFENP